MPARFVTFYSFGGGVGKSFALANVAWILAASGRRVLAIDWHLESPGLHACFRPFLSDRDGSTMDGLLEFLLAWCEDIAAGPADVPLEADLLSYAVSLNWDFPSEGRLDYVPAGKHNATYWARVSSISWPTFYDQLHGLTLMRQIKTKLTPDYDVVLVDSPPGFHITASACLTELSDAIVCCFRLSEPSISGTVSALDAFLTGTASSRSVFPVPMMVEPAEKELLERSRAFARSAFDAQIGRFDPDKRSRYWNEVELPYVPWYAFGARLAAFSDERYTRSSLLAAIVRLASWLVGDEIKVKPVPAELRQKAALLYNQLSTL
jgi:cellulose biosynthesis protein BcsQ